MIVFVFTVFISCTQQDEFYSTQKSEVVVPSGTGRMFFSSPDDVNSFIKAIESGDDVCSATRAVKGGVIQEVGFVSLLDTKKAECLASLTPIQRDSIQNDSDNLEFCLNDSIVASEAFAKILNGDREIEVGSMVYKYIGQGVVYTSTSNAKKLKNLDLIEIDKKIELKPGECQIILEDGLTLIPIDYSQKNLSSSSSSVSSSYIPTTPNSNTQDSNFMLKNGTTIPDVKDIEYKAGGEGSWWYKFSTGLFGENVVGYQAFSNEKRRMRFEFCNQNYIVYAYTGVDLKMQKKVCGLWWNINAEEMHLGWTAIEFKHTFDRPIKMQAPELDKISFINNPLNLGTNESILIHFPSDSYDFATSSLSSILKNGLKEAMKKYPKSLCDKLNKIGEEKLSAFTAYDIYLYVLLGAYEIESTDTKHFKTSFYSQWLPGNYEVGFCYDGSFLMSSIKFDGGSQVEFRRGIVYGAVKYDGEWRAIRITKTAADD